MRSAAFGIGIILIVLSIFGFVVAYNYNYLAGVNLRSTTTSTSTSQTSTTASTSTGSSTMVSTGSGALQNGGFETGSFPPWAPNNSPNGFVTVTNTVKHSGQYAAYMKAPPSSGSVGLTTVQFYQHFSTVPLPYTLTAFWYNVAYPDQACVHPYTQWLITSDGSTGTVEDGFSPTGSGRGFVFFGANGIASGSSSSTYPTNTWIQLTVRVTSTGTSISVNGQSVGSTTEHHDPANGLVIVASCNAQVFVDDIYFNNNFTPTTFVSSTSYTSSTQSTSSTSTAPVNLAHISNLGVGSVEYAGTPAMRVTLTATITDGPAHIDTDIQYADGLYAGNRINLWYPTTGIPTVNGVSRMSWSIFPSGPATQYRVIIYDSATKQEIAEGVITNVPYTYLVVTTPGWPSNALVLIDAASFLPHTSITVLLPSQNSQLIRDAIMRWYTTTYSYIQQYPYDNGQPLSQSLPISFRVAGVNDTGNENVEIVYSNAGVICGDRDGCELASHDPAGWVTVAKIYVGNWYATSPQSFGHWDLATVVTHEFGHVLGMGDLYILPNVNQYYPDDMMNYNKCVTTLDAYAVTYAHVAENSNPVSIPIGSLGLPQGVPNVCLG